MKLIESYFGAEGVRMISEALKINSTLTSLDVRGDRRKKTELENKRKKNER